MLPVGCLNNSSAHSKLPACPEDRQHRKQWRARLQSREGLLAANFSTCPLLVTYVSYVPSLETHSRPIRNSMEAE